MAKKKKGAPVQQALSPEKYIQTKCRNLPVVECLIGENCQEVGMATIVVARRHTNGNYTLGIYLVDTFCLGLKDSVYKFNIKEEEYEEYKELLSVSSGMLVISYNEAHNIIYGAIAYAEELGIQPCKDFSLTQYLLEEDTDEIPLIEYTFGKDGKPCLIVASALEGSRYLPIIEAAIGDDFRYFIQGNEYVFKDNDYPIVEYAYVHPEYPQELNLTHQELQLLFNEDNDTFLNKEDIDALLALPRETLVADLEHIVRSEIGKTNRKIDANLMNEDCLGALMHALILLAELESEKSLDTVLEVMRQSPDFMDVMFGDTAPDILPYVLYHVGRNQLSVIFEYLKEPWLDTFFKVFVFDMAKGIIQLQPERRDELIGWWRDIMNWFVTQENNTGIFDGVLLGMMMFELEVVKAIELLPEMEQLFDTNKIDLQCTGDYDEIVKKIKSNTPSLEPFAEMDIYEWYANYHRKWGGA